MSKNNNTPNWILAICALLTLIILIFNTVNNLFPSKTKVEPKEELAIEEKDSTSKLKKLEKDVTDRKSINKNQGDVKVDKSNSQPNKENNSITVKKAENKNLKKQNDYTPAVGTFVDERDGAIYTWTFLKDGNRWMSEDLDFKTKNSYYCNNRNKYYKGKLRNYEWEATVRSCPPGWRLPTRSDWYNLIYSYNLKSDKEDNETGDVIWGDSSLIPTGIVNTIISGYDAMTYGLKLNYTECDGKGDMCNDGLYWGGEVNKPCIFKVHCCGESCQYFRFEIMGDQKKLNEFYVGKDKFVARSICIRCIKA